MLITQFKARPAQNGLLGFPWHRSHLDTAAILFKILLCHSSQFFCLHSRASKHKVTSKSIKNTIRIYKISFSLYIFDHLCTHWILEADTADASVESIVRTWAWARNMMKREGLRESFKSSNGRQHQGHLLWIKAALWKLVKDLAATHQKHLKISIMRMRSLFGRWLFGLGLRRWKNKKK